MARMMIGEIMTDKRACYEFEVILNPRRAYVCPPCTRKLLLFDDRLVLKKWGGNIEVPYSSITSMTPSKNERGVVLHWDGGELNLGVASRISSGATDGHLTMALMELITEFQMGESALSGTPAEFMPETIRLRSRSLRVEQVARWMLLMGVFIAVGVFIFHMWTLHPILFLGLIVGYFVSVYVVERLVNRSLIKRQIAAGEANNRGVRCLDMGDVDSAIGQFLEALKMWHDDVVIHLNLTEAYVRKEDVIGVRNQCKRILSLRPGHPRALRLLSEIEDAPHTSEANEESIH